MKDGEVSKAANRAHSGRGRFDGMTLSTTVFFFRSPLRCMYLFLLPPALAIYGRNPDLSLTACVLQIRSVLCIRAVSQGHRQISVPSPGQ